MIRVVKISYHRRLFIGLVAYSLLMAVCFAVFQYHRERQFKVQELDSRLQDLNAMILEKLADGVPVDSLHTPLLRSIPDLRLSVIGHSGDVIYDNTVDTLPGTPHLDREEIAEALRTGKGYSLRRHSDSTGQTYFYSATADGMYVVRTAVPYDVTLHQLLSADYGFMWTLLVIMVSMCMLGYLATRRVGEHVSRLNRFAEQAERGERIHDTGPLPHDELGEISGHIVRLYSRMQQAVAQRDREHQTVIRQQQEKDEMKRRLTNNINHELKTPVASMQLCLDTLLAHPDMESSKRTEILTRCEKANQRLGRLLDDVAAITRLDDGSTKIAVEEINIAHIVAETIERHIMQAEAKNISIVNMVTFSDPIPGNRSLMESVIGNLLSNAIEYSGGSTIEISQFVGGRYIEINVADNGCGIDPQHLPHIFERFYRIDKGRSRRAGGTGLGLAIVKNATAWHGGSVSATRRSEGGMLFTVTLPLIR